VPSPATFSLARHAGSGQLLRQDRSAFRSNAELLYLFATVTTAKNLLEKIDDPLMALYVTSHPRSEYGR
jgi:hypothetical protein